MTCQRNTMERKVEKLCERMRAARAQNSVEAKQHEDMLRAIEERRQAKEREFAQYQEDLLSPDPEARRRAAIYRDANGLRGR